MSKNLAATIDVNTSDQRRIIPSVFFLLVVSFVAALAGVFFSECEWGMTSCKLKLLRIMDYLAKSLQKAAASMQRKMYYGKQYLYYLLTRFEHKSGDTLKEVL